MQEFEKPTYLHLIEMNHIIYFGIYGGTCDLWVWIIKKETWSLFNCWFTQMEAFIMIVLFE
jgi:hypothetical protein